MKPINIHVRPVPSFSVWTGAVESEALTTPWKAPYYAAGRSTKEHRRHLLELKSAAQRAEQTLNEATTTLKSKTWQMLDGSHPSLRAKASDPVQKRDVLLNQAVSLNRVGALDDASMVLASLNNKTVAKLTPSHHLAYLTSLQASRVHQTLSATKANYDPITALKLMGDWSGHARYVEAMRCKEELDATDRNNASLSMEALMRVALSCGFQQVCRIPDELYDTLGRQHAPPTGAVYSTLITALGMCGRLDEAESVFRWLKYTHSEHVDITHYNALLSACKENKAYDRVDELWNELVSVRYPRPNVQTAEIVLRAIFNHAYTPVVGTVADFGDINHVEKRKVPGILSTMAQIGVPEHLLSLPVRIELTDIRRKYVMLNDRFYTWGRATKQFEYIKFRKEASWTANVKEVTPSVLGSSQRQPIPEEGWENKGLLQTTPTDYPSWLVEKPKWESPPLQHATNISQLQESFTNKGGAQRWHIQSDSIHARDESWATDSPQTRYDTMYGSSRPDITSHGIRQHLQSETSGGPSSETWQRDASLVRSAVNAATRARAKTDASRTHQPV